MLSWFQKKCKEEENSIEKKPQLKVQGDKQKKEEEFYKNKIMDFIASEALEILDKTLSFLDLTQA